MWTRQAVASLSRRASNARYNPIFRSLHHQRSVSTLQETLAAQVPEKQKQLNDLKKNHGDKVYVIKRIFCIFVKKMGSRFSAWLLVTLVVSAR
jgi:hypothetical protein